MTTVGETAEPVTDLLLLAHRGTAYFLRWLSLMHEPDYDKSPDPHAPASRRHTIAEIGYDARGFARLAEELREGSHQPRTFPSPTERSDAIDLGSSLPPRALRHLVEHSAVHLSVEWRDLPAERWQRRGADANGAPITPSESVWIRAKQVWIAAADLGSGGSFADFPVDVLDGIIRDRCVEISAGGESLSWGDGVLSRDGITARASKADLARWLCDRGERGVTFEKAAASWTSH